MPNTTNCIRNGFEDHRATTLLSSVLARPCLGAILPLKVTAVDASEHARPPKAIAPSQEVVHVGDSRSAKEFGTVDSLDCSAKALHGESHRRLAHSVATDQANIISSWID